MDSTLIDWLLNGDPSIQFQTKQDLLDNTDLVLKQSITQSGWAKAMLEKQKPDGHWGDDYYQPKWISTHYTLLDLRNMRIAPEIVSLQDTIANIATHGKASDGGIKLGPSTAHRSDVCVNGMFLNFASYFLTDEAYLQSLVDVLINEQMPDGGFNCRTTRSGATHSSMHSTISVLEGLTTYLKNGYTYRKHSVQELIEDCTEFLLLHRLYLSDRTGRVIHKDFLKLSYPGRWKYDILRALDYMQFANRNWDERLAPAIEQLLAKRNKDQTWNMQAAHPGQVHVKMEQAGKPGRWNTLRALRVLKHFDI
jgi:hypothetical protein